MAALTAVAAVALHIAFHDTAPAAVIAGLALYLVGLDAIEPLAQEIDQADRASAIPKERGLLLLHHLPAPAVLLALFAVIGGAIGYALNRTSTALAVVAIVALPALWAAGAGAVISVVGEEPEPSASDTNQMLPPEVAGLRLMFRTVWPIVVCCLGTLPVIGARTAASTGAQPGRRRRPGHHGGVRDRRVHRALVAVPGAGTGVVAPDDAGESGRVLPAGRGTGRRTDVSRHPQPPKRGEGASGGGARRPTPPRQTSTAATESTSPPRRAKATKPPKAAPSASRPAPSRRPSTSPGRCRRSA